MKVTSANLLNLLLGALALTSVILFIGQRHLEGQYQQRLQQMFVREKDTSTSLGISSSAIQTLLDSLNIKATVTQDINTPQKFTIHFLNKPIEFLKISLLFKKFHERNYKITACRIINIDLQGSVYVQELIIGR